MCVCLCVCVLGKYVNTVCLSPRVRNVMFTLRYILPVKVK